MEPTTPQKTLKQELRTIALILIVALPILSIIWLFFLASILGLAAILVVPIIYIAAFIWIIISIHRIYKRHNLQHPVLATIAAIVLVGITNLVISTLANYLIQIPGVSDVIASLSTSSMTAIGMILVTYIITFFAFMYVTSNLIPGMSYFAATADATPAPAAPLANVTAPSAPPVNPPPLPQVPTQPAVPAPTPTPEQPPNPPTTPAV